MKLQIELVPKTSWYKNLRKRMPTADWNMLSRYVRDMNDRTCEMCGWKESDHPHEYTHCHEVWEYLGDQHHQLLLGGAQHIQRLSKFECLCKKCHQVHHYGHSQLIGVDIRKLRIHASKVNDIDVSEWMVHELQSWGIWELRSMVEWEIDTRDVVGIQ